MKSALNLSNKKHYSPPKLISYGDIACLTQAVNPRDGAFDHDAMGQGINTKSTGP